MAHRGGRGLHRQYARTILQLPIRPPPPTKRHLISANISIFGRYEKLVMFACTGPNEARSTGTQHVAQNPIQPKYVVRVSHSQGHKIDLGDRQVPD